MWRSGAFTATDRATIVNGPIFTVNGVSDFVSTLSVHCYIYYGGRSSLFQLNFPWRWVFTKGDSLFVRARSNFGPMQSLVGDMSAFGCLLGGFPAGMAYRFLAKAFDGRLLPFLCVCSNSLVTHFDLGALVAFWTSMLCL